MTGDEASRAADRAKARCPVLAAWLFCALPLFLLCQCGEPPIDQVAAARTQVAQREAQARREVKELIAALLPVPPKGEVPGAFPLLTQEKSGDPERDLERFETALRRTDAQCLGLFLMIYLKSSELSRRPFSDVPKDFDREWPKVRPRFDALLAHRVALFEELTALLRSSQLSGR